MKKNLCFIMSLLFLFSACSSDDEIESLKHEKKKAVNRFYGVKSSKLNQTKGVAQTTNLWHKDATIRIKFLNGSSAIQEKVKTYANELLQYAGVTLDFIQEGKAEVRIGFDWYEEGRYVTWSYTGTDCKAERDQNIPTANFAYLEELDEEEQRADVLRLFGQILGLELEHRHLSFDPQWRKRVQDYWEGNIEDIPWEYLSEYVYDPLNENITVQTKEFDPSSIMIWAFPKNVTPASELWKANVELSEMDKQFIAQLYPMPELELGEPIITMIAESTDRVDITVGYDQSQTKLVIDWGDGSKEVVNDYSVNHTYNTIGNYTITYHGDSAKITGIFCHDNSITYLDVSKCANLNYFTCFSHGLEEINIANNLELERIDTRNSSISKLTVSEKDYHNLTYLSIGIAMRDYSILYKVPKLYTIEADLWDWDARDFNLSKCFGLREFRGLLGGYIDFSNNYNLTSLRILGYNDNSVAYSSLLATLNTLQGGGGTLEFPPSDINEDKKREIKHICALKNWEVIFLLIP